MGPGRYWSTPCSFSKTPGCSFFPLKQTGGDAGNKISDLKVLSLEVPTFSTWKTASFACSMPRSASRTGMLLLCAPESPLQTAAGYPKPLRKPRRLGSPGCFRSRNSRGGLCQCSNQGWRRWNIWSPHTISLCRRKRSAVYVNSQRMKADSRLLGWRNILRGNFGLSHDQF
jgi:hypothetical protein